MVQAQPWYAGRRVDYEIYPETFLFVNIWILSLKVQFHSPKSEKLEWNRNVNLYLGISWSP